ncbi:MAG: hypothetical protein IT193_08905 [Propionibacteriaceae bacterium]|nr:hypothetical protein [Propionibacteriaceae bacterium]
MNPRLRSRVTRLIAIALVMAGSLVAAPASAASVPALPAAVTSCSGVWVVVDRGDGDSTVRCATSYRTGTSALASARLTAKTKYGFVCQIAGFPATCDPTAALGYWSYWKSSPQPDGTWGEWTYATKGATSSKPVKGAAEGWRWQPLAPQGTAPDLKPPAAYASAPKPVIAGTAKVGRVLTADPGVWLPTPETLTFQWYRSGKKIRNATGASYQLTRSDRTKRIKVKVTARGPELQTVSRTSAQTAKVKS